MSDTLWALSREEFEWYAEEWTEVNDGKLVVTASMGAGSTPPMAVDEDDHLGYLYDFRFPLELFGDGADALDRGEHPVGHFTIGEEFVDETHEAVQTPTEYFDALRELMDEVGGPDTETAVIFGVFGTQSGNYRMTGSSRSGTYRLAAARFPSDALSGDMEPIRATSASIAAPLVIPMDELVPEAQAYARDELNEFEFIDRSPEMTAEEVLETLREVSEGDRVQINDRNRPLTVASSEQHSPGRWRVKLRGNGTTYEVLWRLEDSRTRRPKLKWTTDSEHIETIEIVERSETEQQEVTA